MEVIYQHVFQKSKKKFTNIENGNATIVILLWEDYTITTKLSWKYNGKIVKTAWHLIYLLMHINITSYALLIKNNFT